MGLIISLIATALCAVVYVRMVRREVPEPVSKKNAVIPFVLGVVSVVLSFALTMGIGAFFLYVLKFSVSQSISNIVLRAVSRAFFNAGFCEELTKLVVSLIAVKIIKPKNLYEYVLAFAGVAFGFTLLEENVYSSGGISILGRIPTFAMHMAFQLIMGTCLGRARFERQNGGSKVGGKIFLGFFLPVLWHTVYDACTAFNPAFESEDEAVQLIGAVIAVIVVIASTVLQFVLLAQYKKNTEKLCATELSSQ